MREVVQRNATGGALGTPTRLPVSVRALDTVVGDPHRFDEAAMGLDHGLALLLGVGRAIGLPDAVAFLLQCFVQFLHKHYLRF